eukprot:GFYU01003251.1.p1 GENE.GFYU01003251.1~~GFYU01003251.1.p1  ORF type:complete len:117 (-),score=25.36 GFYU01003251.1:144-494(-)
MFPLNVILEERLIANREDPYRETKRITMRVFIVGLTALIAVELPAFELVTSFVGSFSNGLVAYILPPIFYLKFFGDEISRKESMWVKFVFCVGLLGSSYSSIVVLLEICGFTVTYG